MSGARFRLGPFLLAVPLLLLACTERTPNYCAKPSDCKAPSVCSDNHACVEAASDAGPDGGPLVDTGTDRPVDVASDVAGGDAPRDGAGLDGDVAPAPDGSTDRADANPDVDGAAPEVHTGCNTNTDCTDPNKPACISLTGICVGCLNNVDCKNPQAKVCDKPVTTCVQCLTNTDCTDPSTPICEAKACRGCKADSECATVGPGVCMSHLDGRCATDDETVYVQNLPNPCSDTGPGSRTLPICQSQVALDIARVGRPPGTDAGAAADGGDARTDGGDAGGAQKAIKDLVVMRGAAALTQWSIDAPGRTITVVGQAGAVIAPGANIGIQVLNGTIYLRNLRVRQGTQVGVTASGGELHMDGCIVDGNMGGGVQINNAGFDISNSMIFGNGQGTFGTTTFWSGIFLGTIPTGVLSRFVNNTVADNQTGGMVCTLAPQPRSGIILWHNGAGGSSDATPGCQVVACCGGAVSPAFSADYHLTSASTTCIDKVPISSAPAYDIDGQARPSGASSDCGADEFFATP